MSVPEPERHKGRLEVHVKAQALAAYTALILKNPKVFDPEIDAELINRIRGCAYDIYVKSWSANRIRAETNATNRRMRYERMEADPNRLKATRRKYFRLVQKCKRGEISREKVDQSYRCWRECAGKGDGYRMLQNMDRYYHNLWESDENAQNHQADGASGNGRRTEPNKIRTGIGTQQYGSAI